MRAFFSICVGLLSFVAMSAASAQSISAAPLSRGFYAGFMLGRISNEIGNTSFPAEYLPDNEFGGIIINNTKFAQVSSRRSLNSFVGSIFIGYNFFYANGLFFDIETDVSFLSMKRFSVLKRSSVDFSRCGFTAVFPPGAPICSPDPDQVNTHRTRVEMNGLATFRGRTGYEFGKSLVYLTAGPAVSIVRTSLQASREYLFYPSVLTETSRQKAVFGISYGAGFEHELRDGIRFRVEYLRYNLAVQRMIYSNGPPYGYNSYFPSPPDVSRKLRINGNLARLGIAVSF